MFIEGEEVLFWGDGGEVHVIEGICGVEFPQFLKVILIQLLFFVLEQPFEPVLPFQDDILTKFILLDRTEGLNSLHQWGNLLIVEPTPLLAEK
jgi:hypothetical protein